MGFNKNNKLLIILLAALFILLVLKSSRAFAIEVESDTKNAELTIENVKKYDVLISESIERSKTKYGSKAIGNDNRYKELYNNLISGKFLPVTLKPADSDETYMYLFPITSTLWTNSIENNFNRIYISDVWNIYSDSKVIKFRIANNDVLLYRFNYQGRFTALIG